MQMQKSINAHHFLENFQLFAVSLILCFVAEEYNGSSFTILYFCLLIDFASEDGGKKNIKFNFLKSISSTDEFEGLSI